MTILLQTCNCNYIKNIFFAPNFVKLVSIASVTDMLSDFVTYSMSLVVKLSSQDVILHVVSPGLLKIMISFMFLFYIYIYIYCCRHE